MGAAREKVALSWSGGKDSALAFHKLARDPEFEVVALLSFVDDAADRIAHHRVPMKLIARQAEAHGVDRWQIRMPPDPSNEEYDRRMMKLVLRMVGEGVSNCAFGDLFPKGVCAYSERNLAGTGIEPLYPLWGRETGALARHGIGLGFRAVVVCVDTQQLDGAFAGRAIDAGFIADLPDGIDPCGEMGEFHSFVHDGPPFREPVPFEPGGIVDAGRFALYDLVPP